MNDTTIIIAGGTVICEDAVLPNHDAHINNDRIVAIRPSSQRLEQNPSDILKPTIIDAQGAFVAPGMIDVHSDYIENVASPRPSVVMDMQSSLIEADRELATHGITTMFHSLSVYQALVFDSKPIRNFENVTKLINEVLRAKNVEEKAHLIRHRLHLRVEIDSVNRYEEIKSLVERGSVDMLSFMDHTPGQGQYGDTDLFGQTLKGYRELSDKQVADIIKTQQTSKKLSLEQMLTLSELAHSRGIAVASHDDDSLEKLDSMERLEVAISEFPITLDVAKSARSRGMHTLAGAPNVLMGRSHSGNLSAREAVSEGAIDILCSDYYPAALLSAVFILHHEVGLPLHKAFALVTSKPAQAAGIADKVGSIAIGKRADIIVVRELPANEGGLAKTIPVVTDVLVGGNCVHQSRYPVIASSGANASIEQNHNALSPSFIYDEKDQLFSENVQVA